MNSIHQNIVVFYIFMKQLPFFFWKCQSDFLWIAWCCYWFDRAVAAEYISKLRVRCVYYSYIYTRDTNQCALFPLELIFQQVNGNYINIVCQLFFKVYVQFHVCILGPQFMSSLIISLYCDCQVFQYGFDSPLGLWQSPLEKSSAGSIQLSEECEHSWVQRRKKSNRTSAAHHRNAPALEVLTGSERYTRNLGLNRQKWMRRGKRRSERSWAAVRASPSSTTRKRSEQKGERGGVFCLA